MRDFRAGGDCVCRSLMEAGNVCGGSSNDNGEHGDILPFVIRRDLPHLYLGAICSTPRRLLRCDPCEDTGLPEAQAEWRTDHREFVGIAHGACPS